MTLEFDGHRIGALLFASTSVSRQNEIIVDQLLVLIDGDSSVLRFFSVVEAGCSKGDVEGLPLACRQACDYIWLLDPIDTPAIGLGVILKRDWVGV